jgi:hypothetical protein
MKLKGGFLFGAIVGDALVLVFGLLDWAHPSFLNLGAWADRTMFTVSPFYVLALTNWTHNWSEVVIFAMIGNAILYGCLGMLVLLVWRLVRWVARPTAW